MTLSNKLHSLNKLYLDEKYVPEVVAKVYKIRSTFNPLTIGYSNESREAAILPA